MKKKYFTLFALLLSFNICLGQVLSLELQGIIDFTVPSAGNDGKAIHLKVNNAISDLSLYGIGVANNGGGTDGQEYTFSVMSVSAGDDILLARSPSAMSSYLDSCYGEFEHVLLATSAISQNGNDAIELFYNGNVIETFGDINQNGTATAWEYLDSWAYKDSTGTVTFSGRNWIFGGVDCTDGTTTTYGSSCPYPVCPLPPNSGCTDPFALNYDSTATYDDGSCLYSGCLDPGAINYCATCNVNDSSSCIYASCNAIDFYENFESYNITNNGWTVLSGAQSAVALTTANAISDTVSLEFTGGSYSSWNTSYSELDAFSYTSHVASANICLDFSTTSGTIHLNHLLDITGYYTSTPNAWFRVKVNGNVILDSQGYSSYTKPHTNGTPLVGNTGVVSSPTNLIYDLSAYTGQSNVDVTFESACRLGPSYTSNSDYVRIDNINIFQLSPCSYFSLSSSITNTLCYGSSDGTISVIVSNDTNYTETYSYNWSNGDTTASSFGLSTGVYSCIVSGSTYGCTDTITAVVNQPDSILITGAIIDASSPLINDGAVNLTVSGGTPCLPPNMYSFAWSNGDTTEDVSGLPMGPIACTVTDCNGCSTTWSGFVMVNLVPGCTDPLAVNFNSTANSDDSSCVYAGCLDSSASNFNSIATIDDSSCIYPAANLYFSEYGEGSSNNKYFEVYNASNDTVDLSAYAYPNVGNSPNTPGVYEYWNDFNSGAVVAPGDVYIVAHPSADLSILAHADETFTYLSNGDDGYALVYGSNPGTPMDPVSGNYQIMDWLGDWNGDPGSGWSVAGVSNGTKDHTLVRKCSVTQGNTSWTASAGTNTTNSEWEVLPQNTWTNIGSHTTPCVTVILGCTDSTAFNYNPAATVDDGSCQFCIDSSLINPICVCPMIYDPVCGCDGVTYSNSCLAICAGVTSWTQGPCAVAIYGCTDSTALNYNPAATVDDGSCVYPISGCTDSTALNYNPAAIVDDGSCTYIGLPAANLFFSEYAEGSSNNKYFEVYNASNDTVDLSGYGYPSVGNSPSMPGVYEYWNDFDAGAVVAPGDVYIVAHPSADPSILAEADEFHVYLSNGDDGYALVYGSNPGTPMDPVSGNYQILDWLGDWNGDPGSGWSVAGVSNGTKDHTLVRKCSVTQGDTSWTNSAGTDSLNSQWEVYPQNTWTNIGLHITPCVTAISGCTDSLAINYNPVATVDDSSCVYCVYGCMDSTALNYDSLATCDDGSCLIDILGCTDSTALNYNPLATVDDGSCIAIIYGCTDSTAINYYPGANVDDGSCCYIYGCTGPTYCNYNPNACIDDGSCWGFAGCTDSTAINYNPMANCDDGSCIVPTGCSEPVPSNVYAYDVIDERAKIAWDNMNDSSCMVDKYRIRYREVGTSAWSSKTMQGSGLCIFG
ncbi:MAG: hypothetical protein VX347_03860, partial [Bacteroidota bacterium]|nr:hypothetical protein [Bacteroidota bacterium]